MENTIVSERELVERCIAGERQYQEALYRKHADKMYNVALTYAESDDEACDILQDGFIKVFRSLPGFKFEGSLEGWIRRIIVNTALELCRKKKSEQETLSAYYTGSEEQSNHVAEDISAKELMKLVNCLPAKAALVLKLYAIEGYGHKEIAQQLCISEGTSKSQLNRARFLLKEALTKHHA